MPKSGTNGHGGAQAVDSHRSRPHSRIDRRMLVTAWTSTVAGALIVGLIAGYGIPQHISSESIANSTSRSAEIIAALESGSLEPGTETLSEDEVSELSDSEVEEILDVSKEAVEDAQLEFADDVSAADYEKAIAAYQQISAELDRIIATEGVEGLVERFPADSTEEQYDQVSEPVIETAASRCMTVYKWQLQTIAWIAIAYGTFVSIAALFAGSITIVGLPAGAVVAAAGISLAAVGQYFLWVVDRQKWNYKKVCF